MLIKFSKGGFGELNDNLTFYQKKCNLVCMVNSFEIEAHIRDT